MRNFLQIAAGIDITPLLLELQRQPDLWDKNPCRLSTLGPHHESHDIVLRYKDEGPCLKDPSKWKEHSNKHIPEWYKSIDHLPSAKPLIYDLARRVSAEMIGGVLIYKLEPGKKIYPHIDPGWHVDFYDKFNICLQSNAKAAFVYDDEVMVQHPGDVHHFSNQVTHSVVNDGDCDHIVMTVCLRLDRGGRVPWSPSDFSLEAALKGL